MAKKNTCKVYTGKAAAALLAQRPLQPSKGVQNLKEAAIASGRIAPVEELTDKNWNKVQPRVNALEPNEVKALELARKLIQAYEAYDFSGSLEKAQQVMLLRNDIYRLLPPGRARAAINWAREQANY